MRKVCTLFKSKSVCVCAFVILQVWTVWEVSHKVILLHWGQGLLSSASLLFALSLSLPLLLWLSWPQPSGCRAKWSVSEEGHPLGVVFGTNTAAAFPLLYPSVGFGPLLWTTAPIWPGFSKHACTAARPLYTRLFCKYCRQQLNVGNGTGILDGGSVRTLGKGHSHDIYKP